MSRSAPFLVSASVGAWLAVACASPQPIAMPIHPTAPPASCAPPATASAAPEVLPSASAAPSPPPLAPIVDAVADVHGLKMHYRRQGSGPTLVLLHGGSASAELCWGAAFATFAPKFDVIAPDQMGHGRTPDDPKRAFDYHAMAEDTVLFLAQLGVTSAYFVGWSDGGNLALDIAIHHPTLAKKIVTSGADAKADAQDPHVLAWLRKATGDNWPKSIRDDYARISPDGADHFPVLIERLKKMWLSQPNFSTKELASIKSSALIVAGDHDIVPADHSAMIARTIPGAELAILPHAHHDVVLTDAARWNAVVMAFLEETPKSDAH
jgi:pimeloyl-ACP methyl ester carboxylesterase